MGYVTVGPGYLRENGTSVGCRVSGMLVPDACLASAGKAGSLTDTLSIALKPPEQVGAK